MRDTQPTGFVRIEQRAKGPVAYSQIRCGSHCDKAQHVETIGPVHVERKGKVWKPIRSKPAAGILTLSEAEQVLRERIEAFSGTPSASAGLTFGRAVEDWLDHVENVEQRRKSTVRDYRGTAANHLTPHFGADTSLADITFQDCDAFRSQLLRNGHLSRRTVQKVLILLGGIFKVAQRRHGFPANPAALVKKDSIPQGEVIYFTLPQVESIAERASDSDACLIRVMAGIGLRRGEMVALRWEDVDFEGRKITVRRNFVAGIETTPKDHEIRSVPMNDEVRAILAERASFEGLVFPGPFGEHQDPDALSRRFTAAKIAAGLAEHPGTLENLRHTFATFAADRAPLPKVQRWLGHSDLKTTMRYCGVVEHSDDAQLLSRVAV